MEPLRCSRISHYVRGAAYFTAAHTASVAIALARIQDATAAAPCTFRLATIPSAARHGFRTTSVRAQIEVLQPSMRRSDMLAIDAFTTVYPK